MNAVSARSQRGRHAHVALLDLSPARCPWKNPQGYPLPPKTIFAAIPDACRESAKKFERLIRPLLVVADTALALSEGGFRGRPKLRDGRAAAGVVWPADASRPAQGPSGLSKPVAAAP